MAENPSGSLVVKPWARKLRLDAAFQVRGAEIADRDVFCWLTMAHDGTCSDPQMAYFREENDVQPMFNQWISGEQILTQWRLSFDHPMARCRALTFCICIPGISQFLLWKLPMFHD